MTISPRIHKIYAYVCGAAAVVAGICLMIACIGIWGAGDAPFTPGSVKAAFTPISIPVYLCLALVLGGIALDAVSTAATEKPRAARQMSVLLKRQLQKADLTACCPVLARDIRAQQRKMGICSLLGAAIPGLLSLVFLGYGVNPGNFSVDDPTGSVIRAMYILLPCLAAALACGIVTHRLRLRASEALLELLKQAPAARAASPAPAPVKSNWVPVLRCVLLVAAVAMIAYGSLSGGTTDVLAKAVNICTECVGLG